MIEVRLAPNAPESALDELRKIVAAFATKKPGVGELVSLHVGSHTIELGDVYRVDGSDDCLAALFALELEYGIGGPLPPGHPLDAV